VNIDNHVRHLLIASDIQASGNLGKPVTAALHEAGFEVTIITRTESTTEHPKDIPVIRTEYTLSALTQAFAGQDAVVCVVGIPGVPLQSLFVDAAEAAGVQRFVLDDFAWGDTEANIRDLDEFQTPRRVGWDHAKARAIANPAFTWTGISTGNPIDRVRIGSMILRHTVENEANEILMYRR
jgi:hypothetical protein